nr:protein phosphatase 2C domain-containing protein [uncultured Macellibacteroides sp.]
MESIKTAKDIIGFIESRIGGRSENQDSCGYSDTELGLLIVVCDGMGGTAGGKTASLIAVNEIIQGVKDSDLQEEPSMVLIRAIRRANMAIIKQSNTDSSLQGMGTTATVLLLNNNSAVLAHVGDSRIYQFRGKSKIFRTFDHSMVFDLVKQKVITEEQARLSEQSNMITRALGIKPDVEVDVCERAYEKGDRFLLCTDGISGCLPETDLIKLSTYRKGSLGAALESLTIKVDSIGRDNGGNHDNLTAALIETNSNSIIKEKMSRQIRNILATLLALFILSISFNVILINRENAESGQLLKRDSTAITTPSASRQQSEELIKIKDSLKSAQTKYDSLSYRLTKIQKKEGIKSDTLSILLKQVQKNLKELQKDQASFEKQLIAANKEGLNSKTKASFGKLMSKLNELIKLLDKQLVATKKN